MGCLKILLFFSVCTVHASHNRVPLYRYWNPSISDNFYTTNWNELQGGRHGWRYEGIQCRIFNYRSYGTVPLYRYWSGTDHFYRTNIWEIGVPPVPGVRGRHGYVSEGVAGYCFPSQRWRTIALRRYWQGSKTDHFYTTNIGEIGTVHPGQVGRHGYKDEGVACYVYKA